MDKLNPKEYSKDELFTHPNSCVLLYLNYLMVFTPNQPFGSFRHYKDVLIKNIDTLDYAALERSIRLK